MSNLIGQSFGRYHILEQLGEGGMATVYKAYDTRVETDVAVKVIRTENLPQNAIERALKRFEREAKALARLTHPNIVKVMDYGEHEGKPYLIMPYFPGGTLKEKMGKPIPWREAFQILLPIAEALDYAHSQKMVHRDVKPSNILLTERGQPMLTDFGIAKFLEMEETQDLTGTSAALGTPEYMAPEQSTARTVDHRADIYAFGIVLYEMLIGRKPYTADTPLAILIKHAHDPLPSPKMFVPDLPDAVERILLKALAKKPEDRYQSMGEMAKAFENLLENGGMQSASESKLKIKPNILMIATGLVALVLLAMFGLPALIGKQEPTPQVSMTPKNTAMPASTSKAISTDKPNDAPAPTTPTTSPQAEQARAFAAPILDAIANRAPDYVDDFENPASGWLTGNAGHPTGGKGEIGYKNGQYSMALSEGQCLDTNVPRQRVFSDLVFETQLLFIASDSALSNIDFRWWETATGHGSYHVSWRTDGFFTLEKETWVGKVQTLQELGRGMSLTPPANSEPIHVLFIAVGPQFVLYVNDKPYLTATDPQFSDRDKTGYLKFGLCSNTLSPIEARWDYLRIWDISNLKVP